MRINEIRTKIGRYQNRFLIKSADNSGDMKTRFRGSGLQFKEHQVYAPGDDVRFIDWKILAKTNTPFIKTFEEERSTQIHCLVDVGKSMLMGRDGVSKLQLALEFCVFLYYVAEKTKDRVYVTLVSDNVKSLQAGYGELAVNRFLNQLSHAGIISESGLINISKENWPSIQGELIETEMKKLSAKMKNVIVLSDFLDIEAIQPILDLSSRKTHLVRISNGFEIDETFFSIPLLSSLTVSKYNRKKINRSLEDLLSSRTRLLNISSTFVEDFKEVLKR